MKILAIESPNGILITDNVENKGYFTSKLSKLYINGEIPKPTYHTDWFFIEKPIKTVEELKFGGYTNKRFEIRDKTLITDKLKEVFKYEDVYVQWNNDEGCNQYIEEFESICSLYNFKQDVLPNYKENIDFEYIVIAQLDKLPEVNKFSYAAQIGEYRSTGMGVISEKNIKHNILDEIMFPKPLLGERPCSLSSQESYKIVREFVKQHINPEYARITSDYDFCFAVKKLIHLDEIEHYQVDVNNDIFSKRKRKPKYETRYRKHREIEIFEMTYSPKNYDKYTPIKGFSGKNSKELKENIDKFLQELIEKINEPLVDCPHCKGLGVILNK